MKQSIILLSDAESRYLLAARGEVLLWRPLKEKPYTVGDAGWPYRLMPSPQQCAPIPCLFGNPGDTLLGKEAWCLEPDETGDPVLRFRASCVASEHQWRPATTMFAEWSRHRLTLLDVRAVPVQDVTEEDARASGANPNTVDLCRPEAPACALFGFWGDWNDRWAKKGAAWESNPYAWRLRVRKEQG